MKFFKITFLSLICAITFLCSISVETVYSQKTEADSVSKKRVIVKFKSHGSKKLDACAHCILVGGDEFSTYLADQSKSIDKLNKKFKLNKAKSLVFERHGISTDEAIETRRVYREKIRNKFKKRTARATSNKDDVDFSNTYVFDFDANDDVEKISKAYQNDPHVEYAHPDYNAKLDVIPNDALYAGFLWNMDIIEAGGSSQSAWDLNQGQGSIVAVNDTGVNYNHPDLSANIWSNTAEVDGEDGVDDDNNGFIDDVRGWDFGNNDNDPIDVIDHGSHVSGTVAAVGFNGTGVIGVAPQTKIMPVKGFGDNGSGSFTNLIAGFDYAINNGADVINNSYGCETSCPSFPALEDAVIDAHNNGLVVVFSAGNESDNVSNWSPKQLQQPIVVASTDSNDNQSSFTNFGSTVDVSAPGDSIASTDLASTYSLKSGTSMAAPHVAGLVALIFSYHSDYNFNVDQVQLVVKLTADDIGTTNLGTGRINALEALTLNKVEPSVDAGSDKTVVEGSLLNINVSATDPNNDSLTLSARLSNGDAVSTIGATFVDLNNNSGTFSWTPNAAQVGLDPSIVFKANDSLFYDEDVVNITVDSQTSSGSEEHWLEAEFYSTISSEFEVKNDNNASEDQYIEVPNGSVDQNPAGPIMATYNVNIADSGDYRLWGRIISNNKSDNSFFVQIDDGSINLWDTEVGSAWHWDQVSNRNGADPVIFNLSEGIHTIKIYLRENGTRLDKLFLTNDSGVTPSGEGATAENVGDPLPIVNLNALPDEVIEGESSTLSWTVLNASSCTASDAWSGSKNSNSGNEVVSPTVNSDYTLSCTGLGGTAQTTESITVNPPSADEDHWLEVENADSIISNLIVGTDSNASEGEFVYAPQGSGDQNPAGNQVATLSVLISNPGDYILWGRQLASNSSNNSFFVQINDGSINLWDTLVSTSWSWDQVSHRNGGDPVVFNLSSGVHEIKIFLREDEAKIDKLLLTNRLSFIPVGLGSPAENIGPPPDPVCGNNVLETGEVCDGNVQTCSVAGGYAGTQSCNESCSGYLTCSSTESCGDGILNGPEQCDDGNNTDGDGCSSTCTNESSGSNAIQQDPGSDGIISFEVEDYDDNIARGGQAWEVSSQSGASGIALIAEPNNGVNNSSTYINVSPQLDYQINFVKTGKHYIFVRGWAPSGLDDSIHAGINGAGFDSAKKISKLSDRKKWRWTQENQASETPYIMINSTGEKTFNIWMREDGFKIDKVVITTNPNYSLSGSEFGPPLSPR